MSKNIIIRIKCHSLVLNASSPMDAILGGIIYQRNEDVEAAVRVDPIDRHDGIPHASVAFFPRGYRTSLVHRTRNLPATMLGNDILAERVTSNSDVNVHKLGPFSGRDHKDWDIRQIMNTRTLIEPIDGEILYFVRGKENEIAKLLNVDRHIGTWRGNHGYIEEMRFYEGGEGEANFGIIGPKFKLVEGLEKFEDFLRSLSGCLLRPVPMSFDLGNKKRAFYGRYCNPYNPEVIRKHNYPMDDLYIPHQPSVMVPY